MLLDASLLSEGYDYILYHQEAIQANVCMLQESISGDQGPRRRLIGSDSLPTSGGGGLWEMFFFDVK